MIGAESTGQELGVNIVVGLSRVLKESVRGDNHNKGLDHNL
jgi:hypothetical protein